MLAFKWGQITDDPHFFIGLTPKAPNRKVTPLQSQRHFTAASILSQLLHFYRDPERLSNFSKITQLITVEKQNSVLQRIDFGIISGHVLLLNSFCSFF